jgi:Spy/CpxP family protein refolding chaperone
MTRFAFLLLLLGLPLLAQPPRGFFAWWDSPVVRDLNLSEDQQKQIKSAVREYRTKLIDLRASAEKADAEMEEAFNDEPFDQRRASEAVEKVVVARGELTRGLSMMGVRLRSTLTPDQWKELQKRREGMRDNMRQRMMERGPMDEKRNMRQPGRGGPPPSPPQE